MNVMLAMFIVFIACSLQSQAAEVHSWLSPDEARIGDRLEYQLKVTGLNNRELTYPVTDGNGFELLDVDSSTFAKDGTLRFGYAIYDTGRYTFPELSIVVGAGAGAETLHTQPHTIFIRSVLADTATSIRENKPQRAAAFNLWDEIEERWPWITVALVVAAMIVLLLWGRKRRKQQAESVVAPELILAPHELAIQELNALRDKKYPERGLLKEFYSEFSEILRRYLENRYGFPALEMTTYELEYKFDSPDFPELINERVLPALRESDLVKFAKYIPDPADCKPLLEFGFEVVTATREREAKQTEEAAAA